MYELSRVRLFSVGPAGARYADVMLDFRGVGARVRAPPQETLFGDVAAEVPRRPSPASVLFLENGGGKSVLIKLIFSVMLPGRRQVVGTTNTRVLEKFVRAQDVAHVLLEWQHTETGALVVTGKVSEWRGHMVSSDPAKLLDAWYSLRPTGRFTLDTVPLADDGRLLTMSGFHDRLTEAHRDEPELQAVWETGHANWVAHLGNLGLDTELFRYQRAMNAGEGEAADAFTFKTDDAFVDFLLRSVLDEEDPRGLAEVVEGYAHKLAQRGVLIAERDFVAGGLDKLTPLAHKEDQAVTARRLARDAREKAELFHTSVALRHEAEERRSSEARVHQDEVVRAEQEADRDVRRLGAVVLELRRLVAGLRLAAAERRKAELDQNLTDARTTVTAWRASETVLALPAATDKAAGLRQLVSAQEQRARPALERRNATARALARGLLATAHQARADAAVADTEAERLRQHEDAAKQDRDHALGQAAGYRERAHSLEERNAEARSKLQEAVRRGLLADGVDVATEALAAAEAEAAVVESVGETLAERDRLAAATAQAGDAVQAAERTVAGAEVRTGRTGADARRAVAAKESVAAQARLAELLGTETIDPDTDAPELLDLLDTAMKTAEEEITELRAADREDRRALEALGTGGLLPAPEDVIATVNVLAQEGITAWPGWRYLSTMAPEDRGAVLHRHPELVDGVVINDPCRLNDAEGVVAAAQLLPRSIVAVGTTAAISTDAEDTPAGVAFLVPPNPAMYDDVAAEQERAAISQRHRGRQEQLSAIGELVSVDRALTEQLTRFRGDYPPGEVARLSAEHEAADTVLDEARTTLAALTEHHDTAKNDETACRQRIAPLRAEEKRLRSRSNQLTALADQIGDVPHWTKQASQAVEAAGLAEQAAADAGDRMSDLRGRAGAQTRAADDHRRTADTCHSELADVHGGGSVSESDPVPDQPLDMLRRAAKAAAEAYAKVEVGIDLRADLEQAESTESRCRAEVEALATDIRALATELIATPDGAGPPARAAATRRAEAEVRSLEDRVGHATERVGALRSQYQQFTPQDRSLEPYGRPRDIEHGENLIASAQGDLEGAQQRDEGLKESLSVINAAVQHADEAVTGFHGILDSLHGIEPERPDAAVTAFDGDVASARTRRTDIRSNLDDAEKLQSLAEGEVRAAADELAQYATEPRFDEVTSPVRRQMTAVRRDELPGHAAEWAQALQPRLRTLEDDLAQIDRHRAGIIERLTGIVEGALRTLRSAQRLSTLPDGLGDWSGQEFLRIKFADVEENVLAQRLGEVIDESADQTPNSGPAKRDGMSLVLRGVHAVIPKGFRVEMLKPDAVLRTERLRVSEIRDVFSGGQQLTAAIILYCTLAALRANNQGRARHRHSGVLFLDNPIGRASAGYLLELQLAVAEALGVQLVYTTGLFDAGALGVFPLIIRLRNDADLRAGLKYLSVDAVVHHQLEALGTPEDDARVGATRVYTRPRSAS